ncbi:MAG: glyceraldehyde 3-phosphate dehydrogenase NAD-binding domain-containing protein [Candidatus Marinimicrobia bacterium]|nr:glyceraldehyde 3-phosphate dehydrogenase NAD-binding domain-containing protein [Candidatus Neomarinimicrobiota bacterium]
MTDKINIGIVGFGRIGRNLLRLGYDDPRFNFVGISDLAEPEALFYLLGHDTVYGPVEAETELKNNYIYFGQQKVRLLPGAGPGSLPWDALGADIIIDCTGRIWARTDLEKYLDAGAKRVIVTKPPVDPVDRIVVMGLNDKDISIDDKIVSPSSSTTQVLALMLDILDNEFGLKKAMMTSVHAYTSDQPLADSVRSDLRRSRSAVENIIPNQTQAPQLVETIMPNHKGKIEGIAFNVPIPDGSCVDLTTQLQITPSVEDMNALMKNISENSRPTIIGYTDDPIVSSDVVGDSHSMIFDARATMIASEKLLKTLCWYDDGYGYSQRILELTKAYSDLEKTT